MKVIKYLALLMVLSVVLSGCASIKNTNTSFGAKPEQTNISRQLVNVKQTKKIYKQKLKQVANGKDEDNAKLNVLVYKRHKQVLPIFVRVSQLRFKKSSKVDKPVIKALVNKSSLANDRFATDNSTIYTIVTPK